MIRICFLFFVVMIHEDVFCEEKKTGKECQARKITVYKDVALVETVQNVSIVKGDNVVIINDLPKEILEQSLLVNNFQKEIAFAEGSFEENAKSKEFKMNCTSNVDGYFPFHVTYATAGIKWTPYYTAEFSYQYDRLHLNAWFSVENETDISFKGAGIAFSSAISNLLSEQLAIQHKKSALYYYVDRCVDLPSKKTIQINWLSVHDVPVTKEYRINLGGEFLEDQTNKNTQPVIDLWVSCDNVAKNLPEGNMIIYRRNKSNENHSLTHVVLPGIRKKENIAFKMPDFSINTKDLTPPIVVSYEQTEFQRFTGKLIETANRLTLKNTSSQPVNIKVLPELPSKDDLILRENMPHECESDRTNYWNITVPANDKVDLRYRLRFTQR